MAAPKGTMPPNAGKGRPKGSRNVLSERVIQDVIADWAEGGAEAIQRTRLEQPAVYFRTVATMLPKDVNLNHRADDDLKQMTEDALIELLERLGVTSGTGSQDRAGARPPTTH